MKENNTIGLKDDRDVKHQAQGDQEEKVEVKAHFFIPDLKAGIHRGSICRSLSIEKKEGRGGREELSWTTARMRPTGREGGRRHLTLMISGVQGKEKGGRDKLYHHHLSHLSIYNKVGMWFQQESNTISFFLYANG